MQLYTNSRKQIIYFLINGPVDYIELFES